MANWKTVQEFDRIVCNRQFDNTAGYVYLEEDQFRELEHFMRGYVPEDGDVDVLQFMKMGFRRDIGDYITVCNYVGVVQLHGGLSIEILPKILLDSEVQSLQRTREIFMQMLKAVKTVNGKSLGVANLRTEHIDLYEIFISMYLEEVKKLTRHGLRSDYLNITDNLGYFKGKLQISGHLKYNMAHRERFYVSFDEYSLNRPENRLIKATLLKLQKLSGDLQNQKELRQQLTMFEQISPSENYDADFSKVKSDRSMSDYDQLLQWSKVFLKDRSFSVFSGTTEARALLFPMEKVFEDYVVQQMRNAYSPYGWKISPQDRGLFLFDEPRKMFSLRPDIVVTRDDKWKVVMDTKWKRLSPKKTNHGISQADMYQMYAYAKKYSTENYTPDVWLLYPKSQEMRDTELISFKSEDSVHVRAFFVDLANMEESMKKLKSFLNEDKQ